MDEGFLIVDVEFTAGLTVLPAEKRERGQGREIFMSMQYQKELMVVGCRVGEGGVEIQVK